MGKNKSLFVVCVRYYFLNTLETESHSDMLEDNIIHRRSFEKGPVDNGSESNHHSREEAF